MRQAEKKADMVPERNSVTHISCQAFLCFLAEKGSTDAVKRAMNLMNNAAPGLRPCEKSVGKFSVMWWAFENEHSDEAYLGKKRVDLMVGEALVSPYEPFWESEKFSCPPADKFNGVFVENDSLPNGIHGAFALISVTKESARILTDMHGWQHVYEVSSGDEELTTAVATFPGLLLSWINSERIDPVGLVDILCLGYPIGERTLWQDLKLLDAGTLYEWNSNGSLIVKQRLKRWRVNPAPDLGVEDYAREMQRTLEICFKDWINGEHFIALSGGKDSRVILGTAVQSGLPVKTFSYGGMRSADVSIARKVAKRSMVPWYHIPLDDDLSKDFETALGLLAGTIDSHFLYYWGALRQIKSKLECNSLVLGFIGDTLSGARLVGIPKYLREGKGGLDIYYALSLLQSNVPISDITQIVLAGMFEEWTMCRLKRKEMYGTLNIVQDYKLKYIPWKLKQRQRRYITFQRRLSQLFFHTKIPFADARFVAFCETLPLVALENQLVYNAFIKRLPYHLDNIELSEKPTISPRLRFLLSQFLKWRIKLHFRTDFKRPHIFDQQKMAQTFLLKVSQYAMKNKPRDQDIESYSIVNKLIDNIGKQVNMPFAVYSMAGVIFSLKFVKELDLFTNDS